MTRKEVLEGILENVCEKYEDDCASCPYQKECDEYAHIPEEE